MTGGVFAVPSMGLLDVNHESETRTKARQGGLAAGRQLAQAIRHQADVPRVEAMYVQRWE